MTKRKNLIEYLYSFPSLLLITLFIIFPILYTFYISLTNMNVYNWFDFKIIGFGNYFDALFVIDTGFISALISTIIWTIVNMLFQLLIAYIIVSLLNDSIFKGKSVYKTILMFPWAMPGYVSILLWKTGVFNSQFGMLSNIVSSLGLEPTSWLSSNIGAFFWCTIVNLWLALPFMIMIMDGAFQSLDKTYYETAKLEGANKIQTSKYVTIPLISQIIAPAVVITMFTTFKQFDIIYLLTLQPGARTGSDLQTVITFAYENAFITNNYGYSSAVSTIIFALLVGFTLLSNIRRKKDEL